MATNLRIKSVSGGYRIMGDDSNGQAVVADWTTYASEQDARDAMQALQDDLDTIAGESRKDDVRSLRQYADELGVIIGEFRANADGTIEICGVDGADETVADVDAARRYIRECAE